MKCDEIDELLFILLLHESCTITEFNFSDLQNFNDFNKSFNMSFGSLSSGDLMTDHLNNSLRLLAKLSLDNITLDLVSYLCNLS